LKTQIYLRADGARQEHGKAVMKTAGELPPARPLINLSQNPDTRMMMEQRQWTA
jgi:hypothetical protein